MRVEIEINSTSYLPEAYAYRDFIIANGHTAYLCRREEMTNNADVQIYFMGWLPPWRPLRTSVPRIFEYHSLSVGILSKVKDQIKKRATIRPSARIFLNEEVRDALSFGKSTPYILRDMGVEARMFAKELSNPCFDLVYCGSISNRMGLVDEVVRLASLGLRILMIGAVSSEDAIRLAKVNNLECLGRVSRDILPDLIKNAKAGLNFIPNIYPYNIQTSTKVIEYCAAGLGLVSNSYRWIDDFSRTRGFPYLNTDGLLSRGEFDAFKFKSADVSDLEWGTVLRASRFLPLLTSVAEGR